MKEISEKVLYCFVVIISAPYDGKSILSSHAPYENDIRNSELTFVGHATTIVSRKVVDMMHKLCRQNKKLHLPEYEVRIQTFSL